MGENPPTVLGKDLEFLAWFKKESAGLTNQELAEAIRKKFRRSLSPASLEGLRRRHGKPINAEAMRRAYDNRSKIRGSVARPQEVLTSTERMDRDTLTQEVRRLSQKQTFYEMVGEKVCSAVRGLPPLPAVRPPDSKVPKGLSEEEMVLLISDVQAGQVTSAKESGGLGDFNSVVLLREIDYLTVAMENIRRYHPNVRRLNIFFLGDMVDGETIFPGQQRLVDMNVMEQVVFVWERFSQFVHHWAGVFNQVKCYGVVGNHGRLGRKGEHSPLSNFDYLAYKMMAERLKAVENVAWDISESWWQLATVRGWNFLLIHGDNTQPGAWGIPFYGINRTKVRYREMFKVRGLPDFDVMVAGHHHEPSHFQRIIVNGSWPGASEFSAHGLQLINDPSQTMFCVHPKHGVTVRREINLLPLPARGVAR